MLTATIALVGSAATLGSGWPLLGLQITIGLGRLTRRIVWRPPRSWQRQVAELKSQGAQHIPAFPQLVGRLA